MASATGRSAPIRRETTRADWTKRSLYTASASQQFTSAIGRFLPFRRGRNCGARRTLAAIPCPDAPIMESDWTLPAYWSRVEVARKIENDDLSDVQSGSLDRAAPHHRVKPLPDRVVDEARDATAQEELPSAEIALRERQIVSFLHSLRGGDAKPDEQLETDKDSHSYVKPRETDWLVRIQSELKASPPVYVGVASNPAPPASGRTHATGSGSTLLGYGLAAMALLGLAALFLEPHPGKNMSPVVLQAKRVDSPLKRASIKTDREPVGSIHAPAPPSAPPPIDQTRDTATRAPARGDLSDTAARTDSNVAKPAPATPIPPQARLTPTTPKEAASTYGTRQRPIGTRAHGVAYPKTSAHRSWSARLRPQTVQPQSPPPQPPPAPVAAAAEPTRPSAQDANSSKNFIDRVVDSFVGRGRSGGSPE